MLTKNINQIICFRCLEIGLCKSLGYNCNYIFKSNSLVSSFEHFKRVHNAGETEDHKMCLILEGFKNIQVNKSCAWSPAYMCHIAENRKHDFMMIAKVNGSDQTLSLIAVSLMMPLESCSDYCSKFSICTSGQCKLVNSRIFFVYKLGKLLITISF